MTIWQKGKANEIIPISAKRIKRALYLNPRPFLTPLATVVLLIHCNC